MATAEAVNPEPDYSDWLTKQQVAKLLNVSEKTVENLARSKHLQQGSRRKPGVPPLAVYHPDDVERERKRRFPAPQPFVLSRHDEEEEPAQPAQARHPGADFSLVARLTDVLERLAANGTATPRLPPGTTRTALQAQSIVEIRDKVYLTFDEATRYSGIPPKHLRQLIVEGKLTEHEMGKHGKGTKKRIRRTDLDTL